MKEGEKRIIFHIDVNNAFLSWTAVKMLKDGEKLDIRKIPSVIGGEEKERHGIVLAKSMPAKKRGVQTAETLYSARQKCPNLKVFKPDYSWYYEQSNLMYQYLTRYTPLIERYSIDECFLDLAEGSGIPFFLVPVFSQEPVRSEPGPYLLISFAILHV